MIQNNFHETFASIKEVLNYYEELGIECLYENDKNSENILKPASREDALSIIKNETGTCTACRLHKDRTNTVFGEGSPNAPIMFIGEAPGADEDRQGRPFVGKAGQLLTKIIAAMGYNRNELYIANVIKCRPAGNRNPSPDETNVCIKYLEKQIDIIKPKVICTLGTIATNLLLNETKGITKLRGKFYNYNGIKLLPTFHPAYLLRNESEKKIVWEDMQQIMKIVKE